MEIEAYHLMASHEALHWWFVGRRSVIENLVERLALPVDAGTHSDAPCRSIPDRRKPAIVTPL